MNLREACNHARMMVHESQRDEGESPKPWLGNVKIVFSIELECLFSSDEQGGPAGYPLSRCGLTTASRIIHYRPFHVVLCTGLLGSIRLRTVMGGSIPPLCRDSYSIRAI